MLTYMIVNVDNIMILFFTNGNRLYAAVHWNHPTIREHFISNV
jgi:hypothetical protein